MIETTSPIDQALKGGLYLRVFRSGGGLRVVRIEEVKRGILRGYGEGTNISSALRIAGEDYLAGGRDYHDVYGKIETHYLTGEYSSEDDRLDSWVCQGHSIDAVYTGGEFVVAGEGYVHDRIPQHVWDRAAREGQFTWMDPRGFHWEVSSGGGGGAKIVYSPLFPSGNKRQGSVWKCHKTGRGSTFAMAIEAMLASDPEEIDIHD